MSLYDCLKCGKEVGNMHQRFMVIPGFIIVPSEYYLCEDHKNLQFQFKHVYNEDGSRRKEILDPRDVTVDFSMALNGIEGIKMNEILHESLMDSVYKKARDIAARKEEVLEAFIAKYGYQPDEMVVCEQPSTGKFWVEKKNKWISVKDRLPEDNEPVLLTGDNQIAIGWSSKQGRNFYQVNTWIDLTQMVTHWMPLPEPPEMG